MGQRTNRSTKLIKEINKDIELSKRVLNNDDYRLGFISGLEQAKKIIKSGKL
ncbi:hypothetical protein [Clostridium butyricum]|uniref:hypothetical protein n=1 Tax=Clostridium butyricum TaxID=1492 RepID=UPI002AB1C5E6|nr:hypothetical protein [Clostridium butyricum]